MPSPEHSIIITSTWDIAPDHVAAVERRQDEGRFYVVIILTTGNSIQLDGGEAREFVKLWRARRGSYTLPSVSQE